MRPIFLIAWREYKQYIFSRGFLLFLLMFPLGVIFVGAAVGYLEKAKPARNYVIFDETGSYGDAIEREIERRHRRSVIAAWDYYVEFAAEESALSDDLIAFPFAPGAATRARVEAFFSEGFSAAKAAIAPFVKEGVSDFTPPRRQFIRHDLPQSILDATNIDQASEQLRPYLLGAELMEGSDAPLFAAIFIPAGFGESPDGSAAQFWSRNLTDTALQSAVAGALDYALQRDAIEEMGLPPRSLEDVALIEAPLDAFRADKTNDDAELSAEDRIETTLPAAMTYMLLVIIFGVGNLLLTNTIEERSNKIVEVLLSSVTAEQLMMGKLIGIAAVGLTMPTIFVVGGGVATFAAGGSEWAGYALSALVKSNLLFVYLFYFLCAYVIFAMIFLAIGAVSNSLQDAQSYMGPMMLLVFLPLPFMIMVYQNPNGLIASILTWIPIYAPYAIMMRAASDPPLWEVIGATVVMLAFAYFLAKFMGRIFRQAILQASPPKVRDVLRLARNDAS